MKHLPNHGAGQAVYEITDWDGNPCVINLDHIMQAVKFDQRGYAILDLLYTPVGEPGLKIPIMEWYAIEDLWETEIKRPQ